MRYMVVILLPVIKSTENQLSQLFLTYVNTMNQTARERSSTFIVMSTLYIKWAELANWYIQVSYGRSCVTQPLIQA